MLMARLCRRMKDIWDTLKERQADIGPTWSTHTSYGLPMLSSSDVRQVKVDVLRLFALRAVQRHSREHDGAD